MENLLIFSTDAYMLYFMSFAMALGIYIIMKVIGHFYW